MINGKFSGVMVTALLLAATGCHGPKGDTVSEKRADVQQIRAETLVDAYRRDPSLQTKVESGVGYAVFSTISTHTLIMTQGNGYGVVHDNNSDKYTYMRGAKLGGGLGVGVAGSRVLVIFNNPTTLHEFVTKGWVVGTHGEGAVRTPDASGAGDSVVFTLPGMDVYRFTTTGVMLSGAVGGAKVWPDDELN